VLLLDVIVAGPMATVTVIGLAVVVLPVPLSDRLCGLKEPEVRRGSDFRRSRQSHQKGRRSSQSKRTNAHGILLSSGQCGRNSHPAHARQIITLLPFLFAKIALIV
jgi:hypothetical protein